MSNRRGRTRTASRSYTARLRQRPPEPARPQRHVGSSNPRPARRPAGWWIGWRPAPAAALLAAEAGHLVAAVAEWPGGTARGAAHLLAAGALGVVAMGIVFAPTRIQLLTGVTVATLVPVGWLVGALAGASPYHDFPVPAAVAVTGAELAAAAVLATSAVLAARGRTAHAGAARGTVPETERTPAVPSSR
jgi:hypothetical protein